MKLVFVLLLGEMFLCFTEIIVIFCLGISLFSFMMLPLLLRFLFHVHLFQRHCSPSLQFIHIFLNFRQLFFIFKFNKIQHKSGKLPQMHSLTLDDIMQLSFETIEL